MDKIIIKGLEVFARHGVFPEENVLGQKFLVSAEMYLDTRPAGSTDDLEHSVNYGEVSQRINAFLMENTYRLIETAAEKLAEEILISFPPIKSITLCIEKPWAPVGLPLDTVGIEITRSRHTAYIALGSNIGDREGYLDLAVNELGRIRGCRVIRTAAYIVTKPYGGVEQEDFLNSALELDTLLMPEELLDELHRIEQLAGRERLVHWGPRTLDLDILMYDDLVMDSEQLTIPHQEMHKRDFVLEPMCCIAPYLRHPVLNKTMLQLKRELHGY